MEITPGTGAFHAPVLFCAPQRHILPLWVSLRGRLRPWQSLNHPRRAGRLRPPQRPDHAKCPDQPCRACVSSRTNEPWSMELPARREQAPALQFSILNSQLSILLPPPRSTHRGVIARALFAPVAISCPPPTPPKFKNIRNPKENSAPRGNAPQNRKKLQNFC